MTIPFIAAGNVVAADITFTPTSGTVDDADHVTARVVRLGGNTVADMTVTKTDTNEFHAEWQSADTDATGRYRIRWESNTPAPHIVLEDDTTEFVLMASAFPSP